jgi:hypothetical protein
MLQSNKINGTFGVAPSDVEGIHGRDQQQLVDCMKGAMI